MRIAESRSLAYHLEVATRLRAEPELLARVRAKLEAWRGAGGRAAPYAEEWSRIVDEGLERVIETLVDPSEHAADLRHTSPFAGIVPPRTRWDIWKKHRDPNPA